MKNIIITLKIVGVTVLYKISIKFKWKEKDSPLNSISLKERSSSSQNVTSQGDTKHITSHVYRGSYKVLSWIGGPEGTRTSDNWGAHSRPDHLSYPSGLTMLIF